MNEVNITDLFILLCSNLSTVLNPHLCLSKKNHPTLGNPFIDLKDNISTLLERDEFLVQDAAWIEDQCHISEVQPWRRRCHKCSSSNICTKTSSGFKHSTPLTSNFSALHCTIKERPQKKDGIIMREKFQNRGSRDNMPLSVFYRATHMK